MKYLLRSAILVGLLAVRVIPANAQQVPKGFAPCNAHTISASGSSSSVQLSNCGPTIILMNLTSQEAFWTYGQNSATATTAGSGLASLSLPGGAYLMATIPDQTAAGWYIAAITATSTTTVRILEGRSQ